MNSIQRAQHSRTATEYLSFRLGHEEYGIDILQVQEIRDYETPTRIASAPACVRGVVNLRGDIVPVVDLRVRLGCAEAPCNELTNVVVLGLHGRTVGVVVDSVDDVLQVEPGQVQAAPEVRSQLDLSTVRGLATVGERMVILLDIDALMRDEGLGLAGT